MGTAIIELNDSAIQCQHGKTSLSVPGYALITGEGVITGEEAMSKAWLLPQQSHNQYWQQLSLSPLAGANRYARHHADLAYAQLQRLYQDAGKPENIIFAVPGNFTNDQLSILLGLAKASPFNAVGLVDAAVATTCQADISGDIIHIDIQLHTTVITRMECGGQVSRIHTSQYPDISLKAFYDTWAHFIADQFIRQYRYDPMHTAQGEQELRNLLPGWLEQLRTEEEIDVELTAQQGNFTLNILRTDLLAANNQRWQRMAEALASASCKDGQADAVLISHRIAALPGIANYIEFSDYAEPDAVINACLSQAQHIISGTGKLSFVTELPLLSPGLPSGQASSKNAASMKRMADTPPDKHPEVIPPSHILHQHQAYPLNQDLSIMVGYRGLEICPLASVNTATTKKPAQQLGKVLIQCQANKITLRTDQDKLPIKCSGNLDDLRAGDELIIHGETLKFIEVL